MTDRYKKIENLDLSKWIITKFYHYTSICQDIFGERDEMWHDTPIGDEYIKTLYFHFLEIVNKYLHLKNGNPHSTLYDNKTTIEITNIETGDTLYITSKDGRWLIGKSVWSEFGNVTNFGIISNPE